MTTNVIVLDSEGDGLAYDCTKLHILSYTPDGENVSHLKSYDDMRTLLSQEDTLFVAHNSIRHDMVAFHRILGVPMDYRKWIDTLALSWFLWPDRQSHALGSFSGEAGVEKPHVEDWENVTWDQMKERCGNDTFINKYVWDKQWARLKELYEVDEEIFRFIRYLSFKMDCLREQEANPLTLDVAKAQKHFDELTQIVEEKKVALAKVMPKVPERTQNKPKNPYKQDGTYSEHGKKWFETLRSLQLPEDTEGPVVVSYKDGNPGSSEQVKEWLFSLGWKPCHYKYQRNKLTGEEKKIPQVRYSSPSDPRKGQLTDSVVKLKDRAPNVEVLEGLTVAQHRASIFEGFLKNYTIETWNDYPADGSDSLEVATGKIVSSAGGFTNTLRLKHRAPIVNLPGVEAAWGKEIRGCLVAPSGEVCGKCGGNGWVTSYSAMAHDGEIECPTCKGTGKVGTQVMIGSDVSSLESCTKRHFMWPYDPEYVTEMSQPGFDEHINLAKFAGAISQEDEDRYRDGNGKDLKPIRNKFKPANYAGIYGVREKTLSRQTGMSVKECAELLDAYWKRNWAVKKVADDFYVKTLSDGSMWLKNPVSGFYYSLRYMKDKFSTGNQGTGVFIFDSWVMRMRRKGVHPQLQYHDEVLLSVPASEEETVSKTIEEAMQEVNETLKLNVTIGVDVQVGSNYAECH